MVVRRVRTFLAKGSCPLLLITVRRGIELIFPGFHNLQEQLSVFFFLFLLSGVFKSFVASPSPFPPPGWWRGGLGFLQVPLCSVVLFLCSSMSTAFMFSCRRLFVYVFSLGGRKKLVSGFGGVFRAATFSSSSANQSLAGLWRCMDGGVVSGGWCCRTVERCLAAVNWGVLEQWETTETVCGHFLFPFVWPASAVFFFLLSFAFFLLFFSACLVLLSVFCVVVCFSSLFELVCAGGVCLGSGRGVEESLWALPLPFTGRASAFFFFFFSSFPGLVACLRLSQ